MLEAATGVSPDLGKGRFRVYARLRGRRWHVLVEPDANDRLLVVVTAFCAE
jgi:hypothetical protein